MASRIIQKPDDLDALFTLFGNLKLPFTVEWVQGRDRTPDQNRLMWLWASEAAAQRGDTEAEYVQREWKLNVGIPILCEDSEEYRQFCTLTLKRLNYAQRIEAMRYVPVTSEMKVRQFVRMLDTIQRECAEQGIRLTDPDPEMAAYHSRYRGG